MRDDVNATILKGKKERKSFYTNYGYDHNEEINPSPCPTKPHRDAYLTSGHDRLAWIALLA